MKRLPINTALFIVGILVTSILITACAQASNPSPANPSPPTSTAAPSQPEATATNLPTDPPPTPTTIASPTIEPTETPAPEITLDIVLPEGDADSGEKRADAKCLGCHEHPGFPQFTSSDDLPGIAERGELRLSDAGYEGNATNNQEYIIESILLPKVYLVPGEWRRSMPIFTLDEISEQDIADIIAWMNTIEQPTEQE